MIRIIIFTLCELLFWGCSQKEPVADNSLNFDLTGTSDKLNLSSIVDSISYINLEETEESLIGMIYRIQFANDKYFIHDFPSKSIMLFDSNGKYLNKLAKYGQGPGEYISIESFCVDKEDNIYILDNAQRKLLKYNNLGEFIGKICDIDDFPRSDIAYINDNFYLCMPDYNEGEYRRGVFNFNPRANKYDQIVQIDNKEGGLLEWYFQKKEDDSGLFVLNNCDGILYEIENDKIVQTKRINVTPTINLETKEGYELVSCIETTNWNIITAGSYKGPKYIFYNKNTSDYKICDMDKLVNDIDNNSIGFPKPIIHNGNSIVTIITDGDMDNPQLQIWNLK